MPGFRIEMPEDLPRYRPRGRIPLFDAMRNYFNDRYSKVVYRKDMLMTFIGNGYRKETIDTYRSYLTSAGYLSPYLRGAYLVVKEIPYGMILADLRWEAMNKNKKLFIKKMYVKPAKVFISESEMML
jgi:hypothetical protein